jgi:hypothetical protein
MRFQAVANRLIGISTPLGGASWIPARLDRDVVHEVMVFLEDRRVLYAPYEFEDAAHCVASVLQVRAYLTEALGRRGLGKELEGHLRGIRTACRKFSVMVGMEERGPRFAIPSGRGWGRMDDAILNLALGELRGVVGIHLAQMAVAWEVDVPGTLVATLPAPPDDEADAPYAARW